MVTPMNQSDHSFFLSPTGSGIGRSLFAKELREELGAFTLVACYPLEGHLASPRRLGLASPSFTAIIH